MRRVVGNVLAHGCSRYIHSYLAGLSESWNVGATLRLQTREDETLVWDLGAGG